MQKEDVVARLPCDDDLYEEQAETCTPFFDNGVIDKSLTHQSGTSTSPGMIAYLIQIASISGDMFREINRSYTQSASDYAESYQKLYASTNRQLVEWLQSLPARLQVSNETVAESIKCGYDTFLLNMHGLYQLTLIILNRRVRAELLPKATVIRNIQNALESAHEIIALGRTTLDVSSHATKHAATQPPPQLIQEIVNSEVDCPFRFNSTFTSVTTTHAVDVLSAAGSLAPGSVDLTLEKIHTALDIMDHLLNTHGYAQIQRNFVRQRHQEVMQIKEQAADMTEAWVFSRGMPGLEDEGMDAFYQRGNPMVVLEAMRIKNDCGVYVV